MSRPVKLTAAQYAAVRKPASPPKRPRTPKAPRKAPRREEAALLRQVVAWLTHKGVFHFRANAGVGARPDGRGGWRPIRGVTGGTPDVLCVLPVTFRGSDGPHEWTCTVGRLCGIELKTKGGRLRPAQRAWMASAERAGVLCLVVRSLQELIDAFDREGLL